MRRYDLSFTDFGVKGELGIWSQGGNVNKLARSIEGLQYDQGILALMRWVGQERVKSFSTLLMMERRLSKCDRITQELGFPNEPFSSDSGSTVTGNIS